MIETAKQMVELRNVYFRRVIWVKEINFGVL